MIDLSYLIGRHFLAKSGNSCRIERIQFNDEIRAIWKRPSSDQDQIEFLDWIKDLEPEINPMVSKCKSQEEFTLKKYRQQK